MAKFFILFFGLVFFSCSNGKKDDSEKVFIIYNDFKQFYLVPIKENIDINECLASLRTENLNRGFLFHNDSNEYLKQLSESSIEVKDELINETYSKELQTLKIMPAYVKYDVGNTLDSLETEFEFVISGRDI